MRRCVSSLLNGSSPPSVVDRTYALPYYGGMITVVTTGARTLIEDAGRVGHEHLGVPTSGAADINSLRLANRLAGNPDTSAALEVALLGPTLTFAHDTVVAYAGADTDLHLDGATVPAFHTVAVRAGQTLSIGSLRGGVYGYLAVAGGVAATPVLGSQSTCTLSGLGPAPLNTGDTLPTGSHENHPDYLAALPRPVRAEIRYIPGPHTEVFSEEAQAQFVRTDWSISAHTSRVGIRLDGATMDAPQESLPSLGMVTGAIQVPPNGSPIVLGPDHGTTGGYPVIGVVIPDDMCALAQQVPGNTVRFVPVTVSEDDGARTDSAAFASATMLHLPSISA
jgi:biotin-dependent carboxylase-like uncharacterized protein